MDQYTQQLAASSQASASSSVLWMVFLVVLIAYAVYSFILVYHWTGFSMNKRASFIAMIAYFFVSGLILFLMLFSIIALTI